MTEPQWIMSSAVDAFQTQDRLKHAVRACAARLPPEATLSQRLLAGMLLRQMFAERVARRCGFTTTAETERINGAIADWRRKMSRRP